MGLGAPEAAPSVATGEHAGENLREEERPAGDSGVSGLEVIYQRCAGIDVHKKSITVCLITPGQHGESKKEKRTFGTMTADLLALADWLSDSGCTHVAIESTGVYWKPVYNILESTCQVVLANPRNVKNVPGRKTDVCDAEWLADLLRHGLIRGSFIPPKPIRDLRDVVRYRKSLVRERSSEVNRLQKTLEGMNIKLASVAADVLGVSGRGMLEAIASGCTDVQIMAEMAHGKLRKKIPELEKALEGRVDSHHRFLLTQQLRHIDLLNDLIEECDAKIDEMMQPFQEEVALLSGITGLGKKTIEAIIAEIGVDMSRFPSDKHIASWAGMCPGNNESAGKRKSGRTTKGSPWLKEALVEASQAAGRAKGTYLYALFHRIAARRGKKRAAIAVGHAILVIIYHMLKTRSHYQELGQDYFDRLNRDAVSRRLVKRLESLGYEVELKDQLKDLGAA